MEVLGCYDEEAEQRGACIAAGTHHDESDSVRLRSGALAAVPLEAGASSPARWGPSASAAAGPAPEASAPAELPHMKAPAEQAPSTGAAAAPAAEIGALLGGGSAPRTLAAFYQHCGVDFAARTMTERAQRGGMADESAFVQKWHGSVVGSRGNRAVRQHAQV